MTDKFKGWIPTVLGNLSFSSIGHSGYPFRFHRTFSENQGTIKIQCLQKRIPTDYLLPLPLPENIYLRVSSFFASTLENENIESIYILICEGRNDNDTHTVQQLNGTIYLVLKKNICEQRKILNHLIKKLKKNSEIDESYIDQHALFRCDIRLDRQGVCEFYNLKYLKDAEEIKDINNFSKDLLNQCFFFIKDAFHSHKHHDKTEDTLTNIHEELDSQNVPWYDHVLKEMYRYLLIRRDTLNRSSLGIFSYIRTFKSIISLAKHNINNSSLASRTVSLDELEKSIDIQIKQKEENVIFRRWFAGFSLVIMQMLLFYTYSSNKFYFNEIILNYWHASLIFSIFILLITLNYTKNINPLHWRITSRINNILVAGLPNRLVVAVVMLIFGIAFFAFGIFLSL